MPSFSRTIISSCTTRKWPRTAPTETTGPERRYSSRAKTNPAIEIARAMAEKTNAAMVMMALLVEGNRKGETVASGDGK